MSGRKHILYGIIAIVLALTGCVGAAVLKERNGKEDAAFSIISTAPNGEEMNYAVYSEGRYCYSKGSFYDYVLDNCSLFGYLSEEGMEVTPCIYSEAAPFSEGLACVCLDGKYGYIGKDGETVLPFIYDQASSFREGVAYFSCGEEYGLIDREGNVVLQLTDCESISSFREGAAYFYRDGQYGYMDQNGRTIIDPVYDDAGYFYGGRAVVMKNGLSGVVGKDGREILPTEYFSIRLEDSCIIARKEDVYYFFDNGGREISSGAWSSTENEGDMFYIFQDEKKGLLDQNGKIVMEPLYKSLRPIPGKELVIAEKENGKCGVLDYEGQIQVPFLYRTIVCTDNKDGDLYVEDADTGKAGCLDGDDFSVKIPMVYDRLKDFTKDRAVAILDEKCGVIRYDGTQEMPFSYDRIKLFSDGSMATWTGTDMELMDHQGNLIFCGVYDNIMERGDGYEISLDMEMSFLDKKGRIIVSGYKRYHFVHGAENTYVLDNGTLLIAGEEEGADVEDMLLTNQITPENRPFMELLKNGEITVQTVGPDYTMHLGEIRRYRKFSKLYRIGDTEETVLYFYTKPWPWESSGFSESYSALLAVRNGQAESLITGSECSGSYRGDYVCLWYDKIEQIWKSGIRGTYGGLPGSAYSREVYQLKNGQADLETSFWCYEEIASRYEQEERLKNAELFYNEKDEPYTKETVLEAEFLVEYTVNETRVTKEEYDALEERYRYYLPFMAD